MRTPTEAFGLIKLRTMRPAPPGSREGVTGGDKAARMSRLQRFLRRTRADEIPQLWNVIRGDMSLVGPRPPLRLYVEAFPELYARVLKSRPGITGLASLRYHAVEERLLAACRTPEETDEVYRRRCVPRKAALDLIYQRERSLCWDILLVLQTAARPFLHKG
jgi:lipopolysaccharide/colanic/teichoic acid biosynthesis glycosyltransferase